MLRRLKSKDKLSYYVFASEHKLSLYLFSDLVKNNKTVFISENKHNMIEGIIFVDKEDDNYLTILSDSKKTANNLLKIFFWNWHTEIYAKIKQSNKIGFLLKENGFKIVGKKDDTFLLHYNPNEKRKRYNGRSG